MTQREFSNLLSKFNERVDEGRNAYSHQRKILNSLPDDPATQRAAKEILTSMRTSGMTADKYRRLENDLMDLAGFGKLVAVAPEGSTRRVVPRRR